MAEKLSKGVSMRELVEAVAGPRLVSDTRETWLRRAARRADLSFRSIKAVFYGEVTDPRHPTIRLLQIAAAQRGQELAEIYQNAAAWMERQDQDFYRDHIAALLSVARELRTEDRAGTEERKSE
jgi:hypothetical protein